MSMSFMDLNWATTAQSFSRSLLVEKITHCGTYDYDPFVLGADYFFSLAEITTLVDIAGGTQRTPDKYEMYGSCSYHSTKTGKYYLFVNAKDAQYLQYELQSTSNGSLTTTLIRSFRGGSGGQVEGCVVDGENGWIFTGEEPYGLWRYSAELPAGLQPVSEMSADFYAAPSIGAYLEMRTCKHNVCALDSGPDFFLCCFVMTSQATRIKPPSSGTQGAQFAIY